MKKLNESECQINLRELSTRVRLCVSFKVFFYSFRVLSKVFFLYLYARLGQELSRISHMMCIANMFIQKRHTTPYRMSFHRADGTESLSFLLQQITSV